MTRTGAFHYSELAAVRRCPQKHQYAYVREGGLRAKREALNLKRGLWLHAMLQADALKRGVEHGSLLEVPETIDVPGIDETVELTVTEETGEGWILHDDEDGVYDLGWKGMLDLLEHHSDYAMLPEGVIEETYTEGGQTLPEACRNIMRGYLWQYRDVLPKRRPLLVEVAWARTLSDYGPVDVDMEGRVDLVEIDERGIPVIVDWKSTKSIPGQEFKLMEAQRWIYLWGIEPKMREHGVEVLGLALDYLVTSTPTKPQQNKPKPAPKRKSKCPDCEGSGCEVCDGEGKRIVDTRTHNETLGELSSRQIRTTPLVYFEAIKEYGLELTDEHRAVINELEDNQDFYQRFMMPVNQKVLTTVLRETAQAAETADQFRKVPGLAYRNVDRSCTYSCDFLPLCQAELYGQDVSTIRERDYEPRHLPVVTE